MTISNYSKEDYLVLVVDDQGKSVSTPKLDVFSKREDNIVKTVLFTHGMHNYSDRSFSISIQEGGISVKREEEREKGR